MDGLGQREGSLLPIIGLVGLTGILIFLTRPGGALSGFEQPPDPLADEEDALASLDRAEAALEAVDGCRPRALTALSVAERELGKAQVFTKEISVVDVRRNLQNRLSGLTRKASSANQRLTRCITGK